MNLKCEKKESWDRLIAFVQDDLAENRGDLRLTDMDGNLLWADDRIKELEMALEECRLRIEEGYGDNMPEGTYKALGRLEEG